MEIEEAINYTSNSINPDDIRSEVSHISEFTKHLKEYIK